MKIILFMFLMISKTFSMHYNAVLLGKDKDGEYVFAKMNLENINKAPNVNELSDFVKIDTTEFFSILANDIYSSNITLNNDLYTIEIDPNEPKNSYYDFEKKLYSPYSNNSTFLEPIIKKIAYILVYTYYTVYDYFYPVLNEKVDQVEDVAVKRLVQVLGQEKFSLLFKSYPEIKFLYISIISDAELNGRMQGEGCVIWNVNSF